MKTIYLIRHCQAEGQESTADLTDEGRIQANQLAECIEQLPIQVIVSSPYDRAVSSIQPLADHLSLPIYTDERLRERVLSTENMVDWIDALEASYRDMNLTFPGGESSNEAKKRGIAVIQELIERAESHFAVVTHGNLMSLILKHFHKDFGFDHWKQLSNPDVYKLTFKEGKDINVNRIWA